ncbi:uncharacterized protein LOC122242554 [Penaeus japonicus]|uniref:uncharacterized protein LOC122242554 n=1 Tax=Penaeus japonicus TaxID=27405 RepID=UPI001C714E51|nr:uncharacterized protein LOC122242554 [Penaeus japonicus]
MCSRRHDPNRHTYLMFSPKGQYFIFIFTEQIAKFFIKSYSTRTWTFVSSFTSTVFYTCYTTGNPAPVACMGRRLRRSRKLEIPIGDQDEDLSSSLTEIEEKDDTTTGKLGFTVWSTSSTTVTVTTFSTNRSVTVSARVLCTYPGIMYNLC